MRVTEGSDDRRPSRHSAIAWLLFALLAVVGTAYLSSVAPSSRVGSAASQEEVYPGYEYRVAFIVRSGCSACNDPELPRAVREIMKAVHHEATAINQSFRSVGVATDRDPRIGLQFLESFGQFSEYSLGAGWDNGVLRSFQDRPDLQRFATPGLYIARRKVDGRSDGLIDISGDSVIITLLGAHEIIGFADDLASWRLGVLASQELPDSQVPKHPND